MNPEIVTLKAAELAGFRPEASLLGLLESLGHPLNARCGGRGLCRGCMVDLLDGSLLGVDGTPIAPGAGGVGLRSCQARLPAGGRAVVRVHPQARISRAPQVGETFVIDVPFDFDPPLAARAGRDTAFAVDVGTTTVVVLLLDLADGEILARAGAFSAQIRFGDNVVTRIGAAASPATRRGMRDALVKETLLPLLEKVCKQAGRDPSRLVCGAVAGNTTMLHILADEDPTPLGIAPFTARFLEGRVLRAEEIGLMLPGLNAATPVQLLPGLSAYIGADIAAGVHATGMALDPDPSLLVDMGTNGEVVLSKDGRLFGCATAAGPAFEGAGLSSGTRAQDGAVAGIRISVEPFRMETEVIGGKTPQAGICGSAYIDFMAQARSCGLLGAAGRFDRAFWNKLPAIYQGEADDGLRLSLHGPRGPGISEVDIAHLLQAKAAIGAGIETLLHATRTSADGIGRVYLAGGFGMHLDIRHAIAIGLLPGFRAEQVRVVGNTSLAGTVLALLDRGALGEMEAQRRNIEVLELNLQPDFEDRYIDHLSLP